MFPLFGTNFLAISDVKITMARLVVNYDIKLEDEGVRPPNVWFAANCIPNPTAKVLKLVPRSYITLCIRPPMSFVYI